MKTGFIGLGHMGSAMAKDLVKAGHDVTVFNRTPGRANRCWRSAHTRRRALPTPARAVW